MLQRHAVQILQKSLLYFLSISEDNHGKFGAILLMFDGEQSF
jgi:hypothetical protein